MESPRAHAPSAEESPRRWPGASSPSSQSALSPAPWQPNYQTPLSSAQEEFDAVRSVYASAAGRGTCECAPAATSSMPPLPQHAPVGFETRASQEAAARESQLHASAPPPTISAKSAPGPAVSPSKLKFGAHIDNGATGGCSPRQATRLPDDEPLAPSPRVAASPRPSFVPQLQLGGLQGLSTLGSLGPAVGGDEVPTSPRAAAYIAALSQGGLSASLSPRSRSAAQRTASLATTPEGSKAPDDTPTLLGPPKGLSSGRPPTAGKAPGKQMQQQEESAVPRPKCIMQQEENVVDDAAISSRGAEELGVARASSPGARKVLQPLRASPPASPGDIGATSDDESFNMSSMVVATPRTPRLSARMHGGAPGGGEATSMEGGATPRTARGTAIAAGMHVRESPRGSVPAVGCSQEPNDDSIAARNVTLSPPDGRSADVLPEPDQPSPRHAGMQPAHSSPQLPLPPLPLGHKQKPPSSLVTEMTRTSFTDDDTESFEVTVPDGAGAGAVLRLTLPSGELVEIPVPEGAVPGDKLSFELSKSSLQAVEMALSGEQIILPGKVSKGKRLKRPPTPDAGGNGGPVFEVTVPAGFVAGLHTHFQAQLGDVVAAIPVPEGCEPKMVLHVEAPKGTSKVDVIIPDDATPGSQFVANVGGQLVNVPCPPHMRPGQVLSVAVAGDSALELGEVRIARPGKRTPSRLKVASPSGLGGGSSSARRKMNAFQPSYEYNIDDGSPAPRGESPRLSARRGGDSPRRSARGGESPGRHGRQDSPGRNPPSSGRKPAPAPRRTSSPMHRAAQMLMPGKSRKS